MYSRPAELESWIGDRNKSAGGWMAVVPLLRSTPPTRSTYKLLLDFFFVFYSSNAVLWRFVSSSQGLAEAEVVLQKL